jgi:putative hydrolase of the HAD superfamily
MELKTLFFDLDETLYTSETGLWAAIRERINLYMHERVQLSKEEIPELRARLFDTYGTTLRGLEMVYHIDAEDYLKFVHDIPLADYIQPDPKIREMILGYHQPKWIFTNSDSNHCRRVLHALDLDGLFEGIIDVRDIAPYCKPMPEAFSIALQKVGNPDPQNCALIDDSIANIQTAHNLGFFAVLVGANKGDIDCSGRINNLSELPTVLPINGIRK